MLTLQEMCLYVYHALDRDVTTFCVDNELPAAFKESWCKKSSPTDRWIKDYKLQKPIAEDASMATGVLDVNLDLDLSALCGRCT